MIKPLLESALARLLDFIDRRLRIAFLFFWDKREPPK
jgi:hypothetical protein